MTTTKRKQTLESKLSDLSGVSIEITIRGDNEFTFSFDGKNELATSMCNQRESNLPKYNRV